MGMSGLIVKTVTMRSVIPLAFSLLLPLSTLSPQHTLPPLPLKIFPTILRREGSWPWTPWLLKHQEAGCSQYQVTSDQRIPLIPHKVLMLAFPNAQELKDHTAQPFLPLQTYLGRIIFTLKRNHKLSLNVEPSVACFLSLCTIHVCHHRTQGMESQYQYGNHIDPLLVSLTFGFCLHTYPDLLYKT